MLLIVIVKSLTEVGSGQLKFLHCGK